MLDDAVAKRAAGKAHVRATTIWSLDIGALVVRCVVSEPGRWLVQAKGDDRWLDFATTTTPWLALKRLVNSAAAQSSVEHQIEHVLAYIEREEG